MTRGEVLFRQLARQLLEPDSELLKAAEEALKRMDARKNEDVEEWAARLAADLARFRD